MDLCEYRSLFDITNRQWSNNYKKMNTSNVSFSDLNRIIEVSNDLIFSYDTLYSARKVSEIRYKFLLALVQAT